jgi:hypothetical protein
VVVAAAALVGVQAMNVVGGHLHPNNPLVDQKLVILITYRNYLNLTFASWDS